MHGVHNKVGGCQHWDPEFLLPNGKTYSNRCGEDFISLSFSPLGILLSLIVAVILAIGMFILGRKKLSPAPMVGSCSAAIAASSYARPYEVAPWEKELKWGAFMLHGDEQYFVMPHCGLSSLEVSQPISGRQYA